MAIPYMCLLAVLAFPVVQSLQPDNVTLLSLVLSGNEDACLGEFVTFTCTGYNASYLQWKLTNRNESWQSCPFYKNDITKTEILNGFKANIAGGTNDTGRGNITLQLSAYVRLEMTETTIECFTLSVNGKISKQTKLIVEDYSVPPTNLSLKLHNITTTLAYEAQVLLVTWNEATTPHSLYNCTVIQFSEEAPGYHVTNVLTKNTSVVLLLHCVHNYSVSVVTTSPTSKCSSQPQSLSVVVSCHWNSTIQELCSYSEQTTLLSAITSTLGGSAITVVIASVIFLYVYYRLRRKTSIIPCGHRAAVPSHSTKEEVALKENLCYGPVALPPPPPPAATQTVSQYEEIGAPPLGPL